LELQRLGLVAGGGGSAVRAAGEREGGDSGAGRVNVFLEMAVRSAYKSATLAMLTMAVNFMVSRIDWLINECQVYHSLELAESGLISLSAAVRVSSPDFLNYSPVVKSTSSSEGCY
jgi:hypothetical protein